MSQVQAALFSLSGGGDRTVFLAPKSALEWCMQVCPGEHALPVNIVDDLVPFLDPNANIEELTSSIDITLGSSDNDVALFLSSFCTSFETSIQAVRFAAKNGWTLEEADEYEGCIY